MQSFLYQIYVIMAVFHFEIDPKNVERFRIHFFNWQVCIWIRCDFFWIKIQLQILVYLIFDSRRRSIMSMKCTYASHCMHTWVIMVRKRADNLFIFFLFLVNHNNLSLVFLSVYSPNAWNFVNLLASNECYSIAQNEKNHHHSCEPHEWHLVFKKHLLEIF